MLTYKISRKVIIPFLIYFLIYGQVRLPQKNHVLIQFLTITWLIFFLVSSHSLAWLANKRWLVWLVISYFPHYFCSYALALTFLDPVFYLCPFNLSFKSSALPVQWRFAFMCVYFGFIVFISQFILLCLGNQCVRLYKPKINKKIFP